MTKTRSVICCDGPLNGRYIYLVHEEVGTKYKAPSIWGESHYELVEWPTTKEIVAYWRNHGND